MMNLQLAVTFEEEKAGEEPDAGPGRPHPLAGSGGLSPQAPGCRWPQASG